MFQPVGFFRKPDKSGHYEHQLPPLSGYTSRNCTPCDVIPKRFLSRNDRHGLAHEKWLVNKPCLGDSPAMNLLAVWFCFAAELLCS